MARDPHNPPIKQAKLEPAPPAANIIVQFQSDAGEVIGNHLPPWASCGMLNSAQGPCEATGPELDLPADATPAQLEVLLNSLLQQAEKLPYAFYVNDQQLSEAVGAHLHKNKVDDK